MAIEVKKELCSKCGICINRCPLDCLRQDNEGYPFMKYVECWFCGACEIECPQKAIIIKLPYLVR